jgi:hypothetical protein
VLQEVRTERWVGVTYEGSREQEDTPVTSLFSKIQM